jgi:hypothetical protein
MLAEVVQREDPAFRIDGPNLRTTESPGSITEVCSSGLLYCGSGCDAADGSRGAEAEAMCGRVRHDSGKTRLQNGKGGGKPRAVLCVLAMTPWQQTP